MATAEKISIALPPEMVDVICNAVATGEYASSNEVIRDALRDWTNKRALRPHGITQLRQLWHKTAGIGVEEVLDRLERKSQAIAAAMGMAK
jgi:antitoxin ParD1/3/4